MATSYLPWVKGALSASPEIIQRDAGSALWRLTKFGSRPTLY
jgi:hypothetical protein